MFKMLTFLAMAMTGTAILLSWIEPSRRIFGESPVPEQAELQAKRATASKTPILAGRWRCIDIAVCSDRFGAHPNVLAAVPRADRYHFLVRRDGDVQTNPCWLEQAEVVNAHNAVRIAVHCLSSDSTLPFSQRVALRALVDELQRRCAPSGECLAIRLKGPARSSRGESDLEQSLRAVLGEWGLARRVDLGDSSPAGVPAAS